jgi:hypothetical protein
MGLDGRFAQRQWRAEHVRFRSQAGSKGRCGAYERYGPDLGDRWGTGKIGAASERCEIFTFHRRGTALKVGHLSATCGRTSVALQHAFLKIKPV